MKAVFSFIFMAGLTSSALAANPLTPAERSVCRTLSHCLSIVDTHPFDSFDYTVLAEEFTRFGARGQRALIKRVKAEKAEAGHAADLLAIMADPDTLSDLSAMASENQLAARTVAAIEAKLRAMSEPSYQPAPTSRSTVSCSILDMDGSENRRDQMPFFETRIARADRFGAFRPSATFDYETSDPLAPQFTSRAWLRLAVPVSGGWIASYPDAVIHYNSRTGAPTLLAEQCLSGLFAKRPKQRLTHVWGLKSNDDKTTEILSISAEAMSFLNTVEGRVIKVARLPNDALCLTSDSGDKVTLGTDGAMEADCLQPDLEP